MKFTKSLNIYFSNRKKKINVRHDKGANYYTNDNYITVCKYIK